MTRPKPAPNDSAVTAQPLLVFNIGHGQQANGTVDPGAFNVQLGLSEFDFNRALAAELARHLPAHRVQFVYQDAGGYAGLPARINALMPTWIISLHANAFVRTASGTETLYYHSSQRGRALAQLVQRQMTAQLGLPDRGIRPCTRADRGGYLLYATAAPCVIAEPFFLSNTAETLYIRDHYDRLVEAYVNIAKQLIH